MRWYLKVRYIFNFSPKHIDIFNYDKDGLSGYEAFKLYDDRGVIRDTKHPRIANTILRVKGSINFQIKEWADGCAHGYFFPFELKEYLDAVGAPSWIYNAIQRQKWKIIFSL